jgi:hypothetical protein
MDYKIERPRCGRINQRTKDIINYLKQCINIGDYIAYDMVSNGFQRTRYRDKIKAIKNNYVYFENGNNTRIDYCYILSL